MDAEEMAALAAIKRGDVRPVVPLLAAGDMHPILQRYLAALLGADPGQDYRVEIKPRPGLSTKKTQDFRQRQRAREILIARTVIEMIEAGEVQKNAFKDAAKIHGVSDASAKRYFNKWRKKFKEAGDFMAAHGIIKRAP